MSGKQYAREAETCCGDLENAVAHTAESLSGPLPQHVRRVLEMGMKWLVRKQKKRAAEWDRYGVGRKGGR